MSSDSTRPIRKPASAMARPAVVKNDSSVLHREVLARAGTGGLCGPHTRSLVVRPRRKPRAHPVCTQPNRNQPGAASVGRLPGRVYPTSACMTHRCAGRRLSRAPPSTRRGCSAGSRVGDWGFIAQAAGASCGMAQSVDRGVLTRQALCVSADARWGSRCGWRAHMSGHPVPQTTRTLPLLGVWRWELAGW